MNFWVTLDFIHSSFENLHGLRETVYLLWAACSTAWASSFEKRFCHYKTLVWSYAHYVLSLHHGPLWRAWLYLPVRIVVCCLGTWFQSCFSRLTKTISLSLSSQAICSGLWNILVALCWTCSSLLIYFLYREAQNTFTHLMYWWNT